MTQDTDLSSWLKAAAENKITTKNTWKSTLIDHFSDINQFKSEDGVNFQKAGCTLDGCMKVYSTRVDDISENTFKLLNIFNQDDESKKRTYKKKSDFLEKNLSNINLKSHEAEDFYDPVFASLIQRHDELFVLNMLEEGEDGTFFYYRENNGLIFEDEKVEIECQVLPVCDSLKEFKALEEAVEHKYEEECHLNLDFEPNFGSCEEEPEPEKMQEVQIFEETPFGYFKGWAGPCHWKVDTVPNKKASNSLKPKEKFFLDFAVESDLSSIYEKADTTMSKEFILERRKNKNILPEDFAYEIKDLYKFIIKDGYFTKLEVKNENEPVKEVSEPVEFNDKQEIDYDVGNDDLSIQLEQSLVLDDKKAEDTPQVLKAPKAAKRVDIKKLKENMFNLIEQNKRSLTEIYQEIPTFYGKKESKDISIHFCLISLLHLANDHGLELDKRNGDILIKM